MEVKIKQGAGLVEATIEIINNVIVVTPKEVKVDVTKFKDGDVITCGSECDGGLSWTFILKGEMEHFHDDYKFAEEYVSLDSNGSFKVGSYSDAIKWFRPASEEEKKILLDKLKEEGYEWDAEKKKLVKLKFIPNEGERFWFPLHYAGSIRFKPLSTLFNKGRDKECLHKGWCFKTEEECQAFCDRLNDAINQVKP